MEVPAVAVACRLALLYRVNGLVKNLRACHHESRSKPQECDVLSDPERRSSGRPVPEHHSHLLTQRRQPVQLSRCFGTTHRRAVVRQCGGVDAREIQGPSRDRAGPDRREKNTSTQLSKDYRESSVYTGNETHAQGRSREACVSQEPIWLLTSSSGNRLHSAN